MNFSFPKANTLVQQRQIQRLLLFVLLGVAGITFFILWQGFFSQQPSSETSLTPQTRPPVEINFDFFKSNIFEKFEEPLPPLASPQNLGRQNPFLPF